jgi:hypothetical protein
VKATQLESQTHAWKYCPISQRPLSAPIVSDCAGVLYNKDAIIEHLLPSDDVSQDAKKSEQDEVLGGRVRSLRDVVEVKFETVKDESTKDEKHMCPITSKELGPTTKSVYLIPCGHAFSEVAIREVTGDVCLQCNESYAPENVITILPLAQEDKYKLSERMKKLKDAGLTHSLKKAPGSKKRKKQADAENGEAKKAIKAEDGIQDLHLENTVHQASTKSIGVNGQHVNGKAPVQHPRNGTSAVSGGIKNAATASITAKVLEAQEERNKRRKLALNDNLKGLFSTTGANGSKQSGGDFMTRGYSLPKRA